MHTRQMLLIQFRSNAGIFSVWRILVRSSTKVVIKRSRTIFDAMMVGDSFYITSSLLLLFGLAAASRAGSCPCVPDMISFQFDFALGCSHASNWKNFYDFSSGSSCTIYGKPSNASIKLVVIHDQQTEQQVEIIPGETAADDATGRPKTYYFNYHRSLKSPTMLAMDFYTTSSTSASSPVASVDLYYNGRSKDCVIAQDPLFWPDDELYFLKVVSIHVSKRLGDNNHSSCRTKIVHQLEVHETFDPFCKFPGMQES